MTYCSSVKHTNAIAPHSVARYRESAGCRSAQSLAQRASSEPVCAQRTDWRRSRRSAGRTADAITPRALAGLLLAGAAASPLGAVVDLHDENFEHETQCTTGATTGDWFVRFCPGDRCDDKWVGKLKTLDRNLTAHDSNWINVAMVECEKNPELKKRFAVAAARNLLLFGPDATSPRTKPTPRATSCETSRRLRNETLEAAGVTSASHSARPGGTRRSPRPTSSLVVDTACCTGLAALPSSLSSSARSSRRANLADDR